MVNDGGPWLGKAVNILEWPLDGLVSFDSGDLFGSIFNTAICPPGRPNIMVSP